MHERAEDGVAREVFEETGLTVTRSRYLSVCTNGTCFWLPLSEINPADFGLHSISRGVAFFLASHGISNTTDNLSFL